MAGRDEITIQEWGAPIEKLQAKNDRHPLYQTVTTASP